MPGCEYEIFVSGYLDSELSAEERARFVAHLKGCEHCQVLVANWKAVEAALKRQSAAFGAKDEESVLLAVNENLTRSGAFRRARRRRRRDQVAAHLRTFRRRYVLAAGAVLVALVGYVMVKYHRPVVTPPTGTGAVTDSQKFTLPLPSETMAEVEAVLAGLAGQDRQPGAARLIGQRVTEGELALRAAEARAEADSEALKDYWWRVELAMTCIADWPEDRADEEARDWAPAIQPLLAETRKLMGTASPSGAVPVASAVAPSTSAPALIRSNSYSDALKQQMSGQAVEALTIYGRLAPAGGPAGPAARADKTGRAEEMLFTQAGCLASQKDYDKAAAAWERIVTTAPASRFAAAALLQAGLVYALQASRICEAGMGSLAEADRKKVTDLDQRARTLFERLRAEYPNHPAAPRALYALARVAEVEEHFADAVKDYEVLAADKSAGPVISELARQGRQFINEHSDEDVLALAMYLPARRLTERADKRSQAQALLQLIQLTTKYPKSALVDDALAEMVRLHLTRGDERSAQQTFDRLLKSPPQTLAVQAARRLAMPAVGWLLAAVDKEVASVAEVFPELAGYSAGRNLTPPGKNSDGCWHLTFSAKGMVDSERELEMVLRIGPVTKDRPATYPNLGISQELNIKTKNEVLEAELRRSLAGLTGALEMLEKAADVRPEPERPQ